MVNDVWYVQMDGKTEGPITEWDLFSLISEGKIKQSSEISRDGMIFSPAIKCLGEAAFVEEKAQEIPVEKKPFTLQSTASEKENVFHKMMAKASPLNPEQREAKNDNELSEVLMVSPLFLFLILIVGLEYLPYLVAAPLFTVVLILFAVSVALVGYFDAKQRGHVGGKSAGYWASRILLAWPIALPAYMRHAVKASGFVTTLCGVVLAFGVSALCYVSAYQHQREIDDKLNEMRRSISR